MSFTLTATGGFSLGAATDFAEGFPGTDITGGTSALSFAWALDGDWRTVRVTLRQDGEQIRGDIDGAHPRELTEKVRRDVGRILSLDVDDAGYPELGRHDRVVADLQRRFPGLRPVLFYTPYEAAAWSIIGQRIQRKQAAVVKQRLAADHGTAGAFPAPAALSDLPDGQPGLTDRKVVQLRALGEAALAGRLDRDLLRGMAHEEAISRLQQINGIGPFGAELVLIRGVGAPDALPRNEKRFIAATRAAYGLGPDADIDTVADGWRPYRSWVALLLRASAEPS